MLVRGKSARFGVKTPMKRYQMLLERCGRRLIISTVRQAGPKGPPIGDGYRGRRDSGKAVSTCGGLGGRAGHTSARNSAQRRKAREHQPSCGGQGYRRETDIIKDGSLIVGATYIVEEHCGGRSR
jgi:hypothetical protein